MTQSVEKPGCRPDELIRGLLRHRTSPKDVPPQKEMAPEPPPPVLFSIEERGEGIYVTRLGQENEPNMEYYRTSGGAWFWINPEVGGEDETVTEPDQQDYLNGIVDDWRNAGGPAEFLPPPAPPAIPPTTGE